jgi:biotin transport system substrate-specific component
MTRNLVLADLIPGVRYRDAVLVVGGVVLMAILAQISIPVPPSPVPITGQTLGVGLIGATLGARRGMLSLTLYALAGLFLPIYSEGESGSDILFGATGGYILGFIFAAGLVGWMAERGSDRHVLTAFAAFIAGQLVIFAFGLAGLKISTGESWSWVIHNGFAIFIVGGIIKAIIGALLLPGAWRLVRRYEQR